MSTLIDKIHANATKKLVISSKRKPTEELLRFRNFLKVESQRVKIFHRSSDSGRDCCKARAAMFDVLMRYIVEAIDVANEWEKKKHPAIALIATGGYGRAELNTHSDIDILFLHNGRRTSGKALHPYIMEVIDGLLYTLWDIGVKVGHSVRTIAESVRMANSDMQTKTAFMESRLITGSQTLFTEFQETFFTKCIQGFEDAYVTARIADQKARRQKFGDSALVQEPNIKNGCGGLRDYQNLIWMTFCKFNTRSLHELELKKLISLSDRKQLEKAYDFLLRVRDDLHYNANRPVENLQKHYQPKVAYNLGFKDPSTRRRLERFMGALYQNMRNIWLITSAVERRLALMPQPTRIPSIRAFWRSKMFRPKIAVVDGFKVMEGQIRAVSAHDFRRQPRRLMRVFLHAQKYGLVIHPDLVAQIREQLVRVDRNFRSDIHVHSTFREILNQRGNVAPTLRLMHDLGFLGKYLPEFGKLTCLVQHDFFHQYTADEHTLICLEKLDHILISKEAPYNYYQKMFQTLERPYVLYLALLLHDVGKAASSGKHERDSAKLAVRVAKRMGLDEATRATLKFIIQNHLLMTQLSQRRDIEDQAIIRQFAKEARNLDNLVLLTLHTFADSMGTSEQLWNGFKDSLLRILFETTYKELSSGSNERASEGISRSVLKRRVSRLVPQNFNPEEIDAHFDNLPPRYFRFHQAEEIWSDIDLVHKFMRRQLSSQDRALEPVLEWQNYPDRGCSAVKVCTWDRAGLFSKVTGSLTTAGLNILSAQIFTRQDGIILDEFIVCSAKTGSVTQKQERERFEEVILESLTGELDFAEVILNQEQGQSLYDESLGAEPIDVRVTFDNDSSPKFTVIDIEAEDRFGLLYFISREINAIGLPIIIAKICTEKGAAFDSFYTWRADKQKIINQAQQDEIRRRIIASIHKLE
jgi:[protein-PII] uridylyltransferase